jgi:hypothetical protein
MNLEQSTTLCEVCGTDGCGEGTVCQHCLQAFEPGPGCETACEPSSLDLGKYDSRMFPWEQMVIQPRLVSGNAVWLLFALGLIALVLLLALVRAPLPSCWELSS